MTGQWKSSKLLRKSVIGEPSHLHLKHLPIISGGFRIEIYSIIDFFGNFIEEASTSKVADLYCTANVS